MVAGFINPNQAPYHAAQNGSTNDAAALNAALADCASQGKDLWAPFGSRYAIGSTVTIPAGVSVEGSLRLQWTGGTAGPAVAVGASGTVNRLARLALDLTGGAGSWGGANDDGVRLFNPQGCVLRIANARGFTRGVLLVADGGLEAFGNLIELGQVTDNQHAVELDARGSAASAIRDNLLIGTRGSVFSSVGGNNTDTPHGLWRIVSSDGSAAANLRNNLWLKPSYEGGRHSSLSQLIEYYLFTQGAENEVWALRDESGMDVAAGDGHLIADGASAEYNLLTNGYYTGGNPLTIRRQNGAPAGRNGANAWRPASQNMNAIGGIKV
jgi:hypothetical protein